MGMAYFKEPQSIIHTKILEIARIMSILNYLWEALWKHVAMVACKEDTPWFMLHNFFPSVVNACNNKYRKNVT